MNPKGWIKTSINVARVFYIMLVALKGIINTKNCKSFIMYFSPTKKFYLGIVIVAQVGILGLALIKM